MRSRNTAGAVEACQRVGARPQSRSWKASSCGARVTVGEPYLVPHEFSFVSPGAPERQARKIWIRQNEMGLQFLS